MTSGTSRDDGVILWILAATAHSFMMVSIVSLLGSGASMKSAVMWGEFLVFNVPAYLLIARSRRAWKAKQSSSKGIWILGSILGGANLALTFHLLTPAGPRGAHIEELLLVSTLMVTVAACCAGIFLSAKVSDPH